MALSKPHTNSTSSARVATAAAARTPWPTRVPRRCAGLATALRLCREIDLPSSIRIAWYAAHVMLREWSATRKHHLKPVTLFKLAQHFPPRTVRVKCVASLPTSECLRDGANTRCALRQLIGYWRLTTKIWNWYSVIRSLYVCSATRVVLYMRIFAWFCKRLCDWRASDIIKTLLSPVLHSCFAKAILFFLTSRQSHFGYFLYDPLLNNTKCYVLCCVEHFLEEPRERDAQEAAMPGAERQSHLPGRCSAPPVAMPGSLDFVWYWHRANCERACNAGTYCTMSSVMGTIGDRPY